MVETATGIVLLLIILLPVADLLISASSAEGDTGSASPPTGCRRPGSTRNAPALNTAGQSAPPSITKPVKVELDLDMAPQPRGRHRGKAHVHRVPRRRLVRAGLGRLADTATASTTSSGAPPPPITFMLAVLVTWGPGASSTTTANRVVHDSILPSSVSWQVPTGPSTTAAAALVATSPITGNDCPVGLT